MSQGNDVLVLNPGIADILISKGYIVTGIKKNNNNPLRSVFFFRNDPGIQQELENQKSKIKENMFKENQNEKFQNLQDR